MPIPNPLTDEWLDQMRQTGDPLADETLERIVAEDGPEEARKLFDLLIRQIEMPVAKLPSAARSFLAATDRMPAFTDWGQVRLANELFQDHGPKFLVFLYYRSLPVLYSCANGAKVLVRTGRLSHQSDGHKIFTRRIAETGQFLLEVMKSGHLQPGGRGIQAIQKVRLIHASIRAFIARGDWNREQWGVPVNQEDMAITLLTFSLALTDALEQFGVKEGDKSVSAFLHTWTGIGHVLGLHPDLLPGDPGEARILWEKILERQSKASEEGKMLTQALLTFARDVLPENVKKVPELLMYHMNGPVLSRKLGIYTAPGCLGSVLPGFLRVYFGVGERLEDRVKEPLGEFIQYFSRLTSSGMVAYFDAFEGRRFEVPDSWE